LATDFGHGDVDRRAAMSAERTNKARELRLET
jgi:hypothetical protein